MLRRGLISSFNSKYAYTHLRKSVVNGWRGRPYASNANAAAAAEAEAEPPNPDGGKVRGRRLSKAERCALLEPFVNEYRAMNAGAFPTTSFAQKQLGGSYYVVKTILQQLKHKAKMSPSYPAIVDIAGKEEVRQDESLTQVLENSTTEIEDVPGQEEVTQDKALTQVTEIENFPGQEEVGQDQSLTQVEVISTTEISADPSVQNDSSATYDIDVCGGNLETKEESQTSSSVESFFEEVITPGRDSDLVATQSNMVKGDAGESSYQGLDKLGNGVEEVQQNLSDSISTGCQLSEERFAVVSHPCDKSENSKTEESQAYQDDFVAKEKDLPTRETSKASQPSFDDTEDMTKQQDELEDLPDFDDLKCKREQQEKIPQPDKLSKDQTGKQADDAEPSTKSSLWGNMKSLANGIFSFWRKL